MPYTVLTAVLLLFLYLFWILPLHFRLSYQRYEKNDHIIIETTALGRIVRYQLKIPVTQLIKREKGFPWVETEIESRGGEKETHALNEQGKSWIWLRHAFRNYDDVQAKINRLLIVLDDYADFMRWITNKVYFRRFYWETRIGLDDAAATAIIVGGCWAVKSYVAALLWHRHRSTGVRPLIRVIPAYNQEIFQTSFECIFSIRLGHIIGAGIRLLRYKI